MPVPRKLSTAPWCPWCIGEHNPNNPYGKAHLEANPATPCIGTSRNAPRYDVGVFNQYPAGLGQSTYIAGEEFEAKIVLNADHGGLAQWSFCPHSELETESCFASHTLTQYTDVHSYWGGDSTIDHWKDHGVFPQRVRLPSMESGRITLRWLWKCKFTDEIFASCIDVDVVAPGNSVQQSTPAPTPSTSFMIAPITTQSPHGTVGVACAAEWKQCGGRNWFGATCCEQGLECHVKNEWYAQCVPATTPPPTPAPTPTSAPVTATPAPSSSPPATTPIATMELPCVVAALPECGCDLSGEAWCTHEKHCYENYDPHWMTLCGTTTPKPPCAVAALPECGCNLAGKDWCKQEHCYAEYEAWMTPCGDARRLLLGYDSAVILV